jgi:1-acyl-sn-glycerol-3-phosphate acyltransferase
VAHVVVRVLYRVSYSGEANIPRSGQAIVCANHLGWWDPIILGLACRRRIYFMAKAELFRYPGFAQLLRALGAYPVRRGLPDRSALEHTLGLLRQGKVVGVFPEGTRSRTGVFRRAEPGVGLIILKSGAPVVPGYFAGPYGFRRPIRLVLGKPVTFDSSEFPGATSGERRQAVADAVMAEIARLGGRSADYPGSELRPQAAPRPGGV